MSSTNSFSFETIKDFDNHIAQSIPNYDLLAEAIKSIAPYFLQTDTHLTDLGCSTGALLESIPFEGLKIGYDKSENLLPLSHDNVQYILDDISNCNFPKSSVFLSIFTLQFIDKSERANILDAIYESLTEGGAFIWAEKVYEETGFWENMFRSAHYDFKRKSFTSDEIYNKEQDLRRLLRPNTTNENLGLATDAGFRNYALLWKFFNFECWIMKK